MLKIYLLTFCLLIGYKSAFAQYMLCQTAQDEVYLINYKTDEKVKIDVLKDALIGYDFDGDTLILFLSGGYGRTTAYKYTHEWLKHVSVSSEHTDSLYTKGCLIVEGDTRTLASLEQCSKIVNGITVNVRQVSDKFTLTVNRCGGITMFKDGKNIWSYNYNFGTMGLGCYTAPNTAKSISLTSDKVLFVREKDTMLRPRTFAVVELDLETGAPFIIAKSRNPIKEATYTPDRKFIYYNKSEDGLGYVYKYDRSAGKSEMYKISNAKYPVPVETMYWLYK